MAFSHYLTGRVNTLATVAEEIIQHLDLGFSPSRVESEHISRAETLLWLWLLAAYEVVRTMSQAKKCFSSRAQADLVELKKKLAVVRMPAAKMEKPGKSLPVTSDRSPFGWNVKERDLFVNDPEASPDISGRELLNEFDRILASICAADVLARHESAYDA